MHWGLRLKKLRESRRMTQGALALASGVKQQMISKLETGKADATGDLVALAKALGVTAEYLQTGDQPAGPVDEDAALPVCQTGLNPRHQALIGLFDGLTDSQQEEVIRDLQAKKSLNDALLDQLLARRKAS